KQLNLAVFVFMGLTGLLKFAIMLSQVFGAFDRTHMHLLVLSCASDIPLGRTAWEPRP
ncbi:MAG: hypothetical protein UT02_C0039G0010, partial [Parcubacteria group bacterium GW2011_GWC2_38_7]